ncbi:disease resistance protein RPM1-like [Salvia miltiorrhiza]|uniref:disease resistance protein RPM1-like n=1 Tax=Salvia miltiorrhiza TaxID=226208 RepID=UPI0025AC7B9C|nr:disease resistance protein RPM1-like [Salvia miltiorrhiza]
MTRTFIKQSSNYILFLYIPWKLGSFIHPNKETKMAEVAVASALSVVQIIIPFLTKSNLTLNVKKDDIESMKRWLRSMQAFMEDNCGREGSKRQLDLVDKVRKIAYDIEDVVDDFILHSPLYTFHHYTITRKIHGALHDIYHQFPLRRVSEKIASIRKEIEEIMSQSAFNSINPAASSSSSSTNRSRVSPLLLDDEMVGYENPKKECMRRLVDGEKRLLTLALAGPAGSGKTTLAKNVFWKPQIQRQFDCHAWVCVSHHPDIDNILQNLLKLLCSSRKEAYPADDGSTLQTRLQRYLAGKRYLVVLHDIWKDQDWMDLKDALPDSKRGSRILITTTYSNLSSIDHVCSLPGLESLDAWKLFCRRAFPNGECPAELKEISSKIMTRCEGLPLAIVAAADALAQKPQSLYEWDRFHSELGSGSRSSPSLFHINNALQRSYMDLSSSLKCCFLYMSIFPEDHSVERGRLIRLWVAERFAVATDDQTAEEVAEDYLNQLIQRNLLDVCSWDIDGRRPRNCRVLNLVLKFIIQKCKDESFASIFPKDNTNQNQNHKIRRLSVHDSCQLFKEDGDHYASIRSMFLLRELNPSNFEKNLQKLKLIKVVDVQGAPLTKFPNEITRFTLMRYLSFRDTKIESIPKSIERLSYLETLDLKQTGVTELPQEISNLHNLCHLLVYKYNVAFDSIQGVKLHEGISKLTKLQNLSLLKVGPNGKILKDLKALTQLRKLGVTGLKREHGKHLWAAVELIKCLKTLDITSDAKDEYIKMEEEMQNPPKTLERLYLRGRLKRMPRWIGRLDNLLKIVLKWSQLSESPLKTLKRLPNLMDLQLVDSFTGEDLIFKASGFQKLKNLVIEDFAHLHMIKIENGAMPGLKQLSLRRCPHIVTMVLGVESLSKVEELTLYDMAEELVARLSINGEDRDWVKHIHLIHSYTFKNHIWSLHNLSDPVSFSH